MAVAYLQFKARKGGETLNIDIQNCNNISAGNIHVTDGKLNIRYAINGTGKSTIAAAIRAFVTEGADGDALPKLRPFGASPGGEREPSVSGLDDVRSVKVFDEAYVNEFVFLPDELLKGSFDVFIRDDKYEQEMKNIEDLVEELKSVLAEDKEIGDLLDDFAELSSAFGRQTKSGIHGSSQLSKALKKGNKVANIPSGLEVFRDYIQRDDNYRWIKWQIDGKQFIDVTDNCPYCVSGISDKKETIKRVAETYEPKSIENLNKIVAVFDRLNKYFADKTKSVISEFLTNIEGYTDDEVEVLREIKDQVDRLRAKFVNAQNIGFVSLKDVDALVSGLKEYRINGSLYNHLASEATEQKIQIVNSQVDRLKERAGKLQGAINRQKAHIERIVDQNKSSINSFLREAGFPYAVDIRETEPGEFRLKLLHTDLQDEVPEARTHLSFGERNAFAVVLFMYDAIKAGPDLVVLDDPISSFDKNKKYAIIEMLFKRETCLRGKTVLMLTHDLEPVVDMLLHHTDRFDTPCAAFLENNHGSLEEKEIRKENIHTFIEINRRNMRRDTSQVYKIVYLRRYYEILDQRGLPYQLLSSLIHRRQIPTLISDDLHREMTEDERIEAIQGIKSELPDFDYELVHSTLSDEALLMELYRSATNNYEKLHIYRMLGESHLDVQKSDIINKFINQAYHVENDYIYQIDPAEYQTVPQYVIDECDSAVDAWSGG
jgi:hypothetical protein